MRDPGLPESGLPVSRRLYLRDVREEDYDLLRHLDTDPEVLRHIGAPQPEEQSRARLQRALDRQTDGGGLGKWIAVEKESDQPVGWFILALLEDSGLVEVGYRLKQEFWGRGFATEMSLAILEYGFTDLELPMIVGITSHSNTSSQNVLTKIGLRYIRDAHFHNCTVMYYELEKRDWETENSGTPG